MRDRLRSDFIEEIKRRALEASPAPWTVVVDEYSYYVVNAQGELVGGRADAIFIANAREDVIALVDELERARTTLSLLREWAENAVAWGEQIQTDQETLSGEDLRKAFFLSYGGKRVLSILDEHEG